MTYRGLVKIDTNLDLIREQIAAGTPEGALTIITETEEKLQEMIVRVIGAEKTTYTYKCNECGLVCKKIARFVPSDKVLSECMQSEDESAVFREVDRVVDV